MSQPIQILGIAGSLRRASYNRAALQAAMDLMPQDASLDTFELDGISASIRTRNKFHLQR